MTSMRAVAYRRVMKTLRGLGAPELWPAEQECVREAADALLFCRDLDEPEVRHAVAAAAVLTDDLIDAATLDAAARAAAPGRHLGLRPGCRRGRSDGRLTRRRKPTVAGRRGLLGGGQLSSQRDLAAATTVPPSAAAVDPKLAREDGRRSSSAPRGRLHAARTPRAPSCARGREASRPRNSAGRV